MPHKLKVNIFKGSKNPTGFTRTLNDLLTDDKYEEIV